MKGQAAIMDALIFMLVASAAGTLVIHISGIYGSSTTEQVSMIYNLEWVNNAVLALEYSQDNKGNWFWIELKTKLAVTSGDPLIPEPQTTVRKYFQDVPTGAFLILDKVMTASPAGKGRTFLCFELGNIFCIDSLGSITNAVTGFETANRPAVTAGLSLTDTSNRDWKISLRLYY